MPEEWLECSDAVVEGEADYTWAELLDDYSRGRASLLPGNLIFWWFTGKSKEPVDLY